MKFIRNNLFIGSFFIAIQSFAQIGSGAGAAGNKVGSGGVGTGTGSASTSTNATGSDSMANPAKSDHSKSRTSSHNTLHNRPAYGNGSQRQQQQQKPLKTPPINGTSPDTVNP